MGKRLCCRWTQESRDSTQLPVLRLHPQSTGWHRCRLDSGAPGSSADVPGVLALPAVGLCKHTACALSLMVCSEWGRATAGMLLFRSRLSL